MKKSKSVDGEDLFMQSLLGDTLRRIGRLEELEDDESKAKVKTLKSVVAARTKSLDLWDQSSNTTVAAIRNGFIDPASIKPHVRLEASAYDEKYGGQSDRYMEIAEDANPSMQTGRILTTNINHMFRRQMAIGQVELAFALAARRYPGATIKWLDIGCGDGSITNSVDPNRYTKCDYEILGCDFQSGKIALAAAQAASHRTFLALDAFEATAAAAERGDFFHIISAFEFLEHLDDPLAFLTTLNEFENCFVVVGSPKGQLLNRPFHAKADPVHLWSFDTDSFYRLFELAGLHPIAINALDIGTYIGGLDWLALMAGPIDDMREKRTNWSA